MKSFRRLVCTTLALGVGVTGLLTSTPAPARAETVPPAKVLGGSFADPDVMKVGDTYWAYATNAGGKNVPTASAPSPAGPWTRQSTDAMPIRPSWVKQTGGWHWAPEVFQLGSTYVMYYTARSAVHDRQCIGMATSSKPQGPFTDDSGKAMICHPDEGGDIDAASYTEGGKRYILYKSDANAIGKPPTLFLQEVSATNGRSLVGSRVALLRNDRAEESGVIEAPTLVKRQGRYVLFYSAGYYGKNEDGISPYFTSYATSTTLKGTYTKAYRPLVTRASTDKVMNGPGGQDVVTGADGDHLILHGHTTEGRSMYQAALGWINGYPVVRGSRVRYEAEDGVLKGASVRSESGASQGKVVGKIDNADSSVTVSVYAPRAGKYNAHVRFAAGYGDATHKVYVNDTQQGTANYPNGAWSSWRTTTVPVTLTEGVNKIKFVKGKAWAELDQIEVA
ncbi:family 43 glycosylhydrolase [Propionibacteriaceae bacterium Y1685]